MTTRIAVSFVLLAGGLLQCFVGSAAAQTTSPANAAKSTPKSVGDKSAEPIVPRMSLGRVPVREVVAALRKVSGVPVMADRTVAFVSVDWKTNGGPMTSVLKELVALLPPGSSARTVFLPNDTAKVAEADSVALLVAATEQFRVSGTTPAAGKVSAPVILTPDPVTSIANLSDGVEVLGKRYTGPKADAVVAALELEPVYFLSKSSKVGDKAARLADIQGEIIGLYMQMSPEERLQAAEQQFDALLNMESGARKALFSGQTQQAQMFMQKIQSLPEEQRAQFFLDLTDGRFDGRNLPKPTGGGNR